MIENTLFVGADLFEAIKTKLKAASSLNEMFLNGVTFIKSDLLEPNQMITSDPRLAEILKDLDKEGEENDKDY